MKIYSVYDEEFRPYGKVIEGYDVSELLAAMKSVPMPDAGVQYRPGIDVLENCAQLLLQKEKISWPYATSSAFHIHSAGNNTKTRG